MNPFYKLPYILQWLVAILFTGILIIISIAFTAQANLLVRLLILFLIIPVLQFLISPLMKLIGVYHYLSPMLLVYNRSQKKYDLHNGSSFDYLMVMKGTQPGSSFRSKMLKYYLQGLLAICERIENNKLSENVLITGSSYFFSDNTLERFGFISKKAGFFAIVNLYFNYIDLLWMYSLSKGKMTFPNLINIKKAEIVGSELVRHKDTLERMYHFLSRQE